MANKISLANLEAGFFLSNNFVQNSKKISCLSKICWLVSNLYLINFFFLIRTMFIYKNVEAQITLKFKNVVVILLVAISISF